MVASHENLSAHSRIKTASDRSFGLTVGGILMAIGLVRWYLVDGFSWLAAVIVPVGIVLIAAALIRASALAPLNRAWTKLGLLLFKVVNPVIMLLLFVVTIVPTGLIMRLVRYDPMQRRFDPKAETYWHRRDPPGPEPSTMINQF